MTEDKNLVIVDNREIQNMIYTIRDKQCTKPHLASQDESVVLKHYGAVC